MGIIQCSENCKYQADGYCNLEKCGKITSPLNDCPYFIENINSMTKHFKTKK